MLTNAVQYQPGRYPFDAFYANVELGKDVHTCIELGGLLYEESEIVADSVRITGDLFPDDDIGIGGTCAREVEFEVFPKEEHQYDFDSDELVIRTMEATVFQYTSLEDRVPKGKFFVKFENHDKQNGTYSYTGTDILARIDKQYLASNETLDWPKTPIAVLREIALRFDILIDPRTIALFENEIPPLGMNIGFPGDDENSYTYRNVLSFMGVMFGGNWVITDEGCLRLVLLNQNDQLTPYAVGQNAEELDINRRTEALGGIEIDLVKTDAVSGERLYRSYIPYKPCDEDEVSVSPNRLYFKRNASSYSEIDLQDYPENVNPYEQGWFVRETIIGVYKYVPIDVNDYPSDTDPQTADFYGWFEKLDGEEQYVKTADTAIPQVYWLANANGGTYKVQVGDQQEVVIIFRQSKADLVMVQWEEGGAFESASAIHPTDAMLTHEYEDAGIYTITVKVNEKYTAGGEQESASASWWITQRPYSTGTDILLLQPGKTYYKQIEVAEGDYKPTYNKVVLPNTTYYEAADYEALNVGEEEVKRGIRPVDNDWYELVEESSAEAPRFRLTEDEAVVVYPRDYDFTPIEINSVAENTNPFEAGWYEYQEQFGQYLPTTDTVIACHYTYEYEYAKKVVYRLVVSSSLTQYLEIRQSKVGLVSVDWGVGAEPEVDNNTYWDPEATNPQTSHFSHTYELAEDEEEHVFYLAITVNPEAMEDGAWWDVASRPSATWRWQDKQYAKRYEITLQRYKHYYRRIEPEYYLIDPASENYINANPAREGWYRHRDGDKILRAMCPWVTESGIKQVYEGMIKGFRYQAYSASSALISPTLELGDYITIGGITTIVAHYDVTLGLIYAPDISAPGTEDSDESSGSSLSLQERAYESRLADILSGAYYSTPDELSTSRRVILYLDSDTSDDNFFYVKNERCYWISGTVLFENDIPLTMQYRNNKNELMYWEYNDGSTVTGRDIRSATGISKDRIGGYPQTDGGLRIRMTTTPTCFPVTVYQYEDLTKATLGFEKDGDTYLPVLKLGAGDEAGNNYAAISKPESGLKILYEVPFQITTDYEVGDVVPANTLYERVDGEFVLTEDTTIQAGKVYYTRIREQAGIVVTKDGFVDPLGLRRTENINFHNWDSGFFYEHVEGLDHVSRFQVQFDQLGQPVMITDENGHKTAVVW